MPISRAYQRTLGVLAVSAILMMLSLIPLLLGYALVAKVLATIAQILFVLDSPFLIWQAARSTFAIDYLQNKDGSEARAKMKRRMMMLSPFASLGLGLGVAYNLLAPTNTFEECLRLITSTTLAYYLPFSAIGMKRSLEQIDRIVRKMHQEEFQSRN